MTWTDEAVGSITLPSTAGPGTPRIVIGDEIPAELAAYYGPPTAAFGLTAVIIGYSPTVGSYYYSEGVLNGAGNKIVSGYFNGTNVLEISRRSFTGLTSAEDRIGSDGAVDINVSFGGNGHTGSGVFEINTGPAGGFAIRGKRLSGQRAKINQAAGTGNTSSTTYVDLPGSPSVSFTKRFDAASTIVEVELAATTWASVVNIDLYLGVLINGVDTPVAHFFHNPANEHQLAFGAEDIAGLADGTYTIKPRWRSPGGNQINQDVQDWLSLRAREVPA